MTAKELNALYLKLCTRDKRFLHKPFETLFRSAIAELENDDESNDTAYTNTTPMEAAFRGFVEGETFDEVSIKDILDKLLYPFVPATFTSFSISGQQTPVEIGAYISSNRTFVWETTSPNSIVEDSITITNVTGNSVIAEDLTNDGSHAATHSAIQVTTANHVFKIEGVNSDDSVFNKTYTVNGRWRLYFGESLETTLNEAGVEALRVGQLASGRTGTYAFEGGGYKYIAYPALFGTAVAFKDAATNLSVPFQPVATIANLTNINNMSTAYYVYRSTNILGGTINIIVS